VPRNFSASSSSQPSLFCESNFEMGSSESALACTVSIVTATLNRGKLLAQAIESIDCRKDHLLEHIIVDGGTDALTLNVVSGYRHLRHIREPDTGTYDAFNKGVAAASGEVIGFLNSDDLLERGTLQKVTRVFAAHPEVQIVSGGAVLQSVNPNVSAETSLNHDDNKRISLETATFGLPIFNAHFFRRSVFDRIGCFDTAFSLLADREFLIRVAIAGLKNQIIDDLVYRYRCHPGSLTFAGRMRVFDTIGRERMLISEKYLGSGLLDERGEVLMRSWHTDGAAVELALRISKMQWSRLPRILARAGQYNQHWRSQLVRSLSRKLTPWFIRARLPR
jgi:glycosyltransferase involved in cell wall biosynthesis